MIRVIRAVGDEAITKFVLLMPTPPNVLIAVLVEVCFKKVPWQVPKFVVPLQLTIQKLPANPRDGVEHNKTLAVLLPGIVTVQRNSPGVPQQTELAPVESKA